jgi:unsaturated chondroitin disaccharide hydrolase
MIDTSRSLTPAALTPKVERLWALSAEKIEAIERSCAPGCASPVFTVKGRYTSQGWTEWTQGFQYGSALLQFDATDERRFLEAGRRSTVEAMAPHLTHFGVHDHGFNNVSTYGNLRRLMLEGRFAPDPWERRFYELALKVSGAVQAQRWTATSDGGGFIHSFNGPHSLFVDTIRSGRALALAHMLGHRLMGEQDRSVSLLERLVLHLRATATYSVYYGRGRDHYDTADQRGRTAHEAIFNPTNGEFRCPSTQQGYSPFSTWTRGLAWAICGFAEQLEFFRTRTDEELDPLGGRQAIEALMLEAAQATCDFYVAHTPTDGVPYWDTGAPGLARLRAPADRPADPFGDEEPVDSSAAVIAAQGLLRLGRYLGARKGARRARVYWQAGLRVLDTLFDEPYLSTRPGHQGLILHSVYHRPRGWDHVPGRSGVPRGESSMWGDYHAREAALLVQRLARGATELTFFGPPPHLEAPR